MSKRQITIKPTCMREILAFPADRTALLWQKINQLVEDPLPDGKVKKKLHVGNDIYRLRVGDHRVFYRFGDTWVSLLGVRRRSEDTYQSVPAEAGLPALPPDSDEDLDALSEPAPHRAFSFAPLERGRPLPFVLTREKLLELGIPASAHPTLLRCKTEEDLLDAQVPEETLARVLDAVFPPSLARVEQQPDLLVPSPEHLIRYKEGDLLGFLLRLDDEQLKLASWALTGPTMVRGGAGTGKSTVAIYRVKSVLERNGATGRERVLFTTYTRALLAATGQLLTQLLTTEQMARVRVATCDQIAWDIVSRKRKMGRLESDGEAKRRLSLLRKAHVPNVSSAFESKLRVRALARLSGQYLLEEFDWIITGRGLRSIEDYLAAARPGRGIALSTRLRESVWNLYQQFSESHPGERFPDIRNEASALVRSGAWSDHWDYVFVDEAQDLSPSGLTLMADLCKSPEGLFFAADAKQSLYSKNYGWTAADPRLQFRGRTATLNRNYRSTREIEQAAFSVLQPEEGEALQPSVSLLQGPLPILVRGCLPEDEPHWIARFVRQMSHHLHLRQDAAAVLVPSSEIGVELAAALTREDVPAKFFPGRDLDLKADCVKVLTFHSAKGLEFPIVAVGGFRDGTYPVRDDFDDEGLFVERMSQERRLLYVGLTRAMRGLMLLVPKECRHEALSSLDPARWHVEDVG